VVGGRSELAAPSFFSDSVALKIPCVVHHEFEVVVSVDANRNVVVVLDPLVLGDPVVQRVLLVVAVVLLERIEEVVKDLILGAFLRDHVRVHLRVVLLTDITNVQNPRLVNIHDCEGLHAESLAELVHLTDDATEELIVVDGAVTVAVEKNE